MHRTLGVAFADAPGVTRTDKPEQRWGPGQLSLLELPAELRKRHLTDLQACHFHMPSRSKAYLSDLRSAIESAGVTLDAVLVDDGDITDRAHAVRDRDWIAGWIDTAADLGARHIRLIAGKQPPSTGALAQSAQHLLTLAQHARSRGVQIVIENWMALLPTPVELLDLLGQTGGKVQLCLDFGNWSGPTKYDHLTQIASHAVTAHAKCSFGAGVGPVGTPDSADFQRCCRILQAAGFCGTLALIYDGAGANEWAHLEVERALAVEVFDG